ncbi:MAG: hypothetical protein LBR56_03640 [Sporomusaceae bacterium]|jgi:hypothetical protein|nr:hypothetical protein [Sporomusaceae bacterium]
MNKQILNEKIQKLEEKIREMGNALAIETNCKYCSKYCSENCVVKVIRIQENEGRQACANWEFKNHYKEYYQYITNKEIKGGA